MARNDSSDIIKKWQGGVAFSFAWHKFADPYALQKYRDTTTLEALEAEQIMMIAELWAGLRDGEFQAFGKCVAPEISDGPVPLPVDMFEFEPPRGIEESNDFEISGWRYEGVKVVRIREIDADVEATPDVESYPEPIADAVTAEPIAAFDRARRSGRPDTYPKAAEVLRILFLTPSNVHLSAAKLHAPFVAEFERLFPRKAYKLAAPSPRTFQDQLYRFRQELAETGNN